MTYLYNLRTLCTGGIYESVLTILVTILAFCSAVYFNTYALRVGTGRRRRKGELPGGVGQGHHQGQHRAAHVQGTAGGSAPGASIFCSLSSHRSRYLVCPAGWWRRRWPAVVPCRAWVQEGVQSGVGFRVGGGVVMYDGVCVPRRTSGTAGLVSLRRDLTRFAGVTVDACFSACLPFLAHCSLRAGLPLLYQRRTYYSVLRSSCVVSCLRLLSLCRCEVPV